MGGAIGLFTVTMLGLAVLSPERFIAERNLSREKVDLSYLQTLSADALPALVASDRVSSYFLTQWAKRLGDESWLSWNRSRAKARAAVAPWLEVTP